MKSANLMHAPQDNALPTDTEPINLSTFILLPFFLAIFLSFHFSIWFVRQTRAQKNLFLKIAEHRDEKAKKKKKLRQKRQQLNNSD